MVDLYTFTLNDGVTVYKWTDCDRPIDMEAGGIFEVGPVIYRSRMSVRNTVEVPELNIKIYAPNTFQVGGLNIKTQLHNGFFDGATVQLMRIALNSATTPRLSLLCEPPGGLFTGKVSTTDITALGAEMTVKALNVVFNQYAPRNTYQLPCLHTFCDANCTLAAAAYTTTNTVGTGASRVLIPWGTVPGNPAIYNFGVVTFTSGAAEGQIRTIKAASSAGMLLQYPLYTTPAAGDTISVLEGCDKSFKDGSGQSCTDRSNTQHYRGMPFTPPAETAAAFALIVVKMLIAHGIALCGLFA